jgi:hypothetical protein
MRRLLFALAIGGSATSAALAEGEASRAAVRVSTHIAGQLTSLNVCAGVDSANAAAYRAAASDYRGDADVAAADRAAQKILAADAQQAGGDEKHAMQGRQKTEAAVATSLRDAAAADKPRFIAGCRDELHSFESHSGSFAPLGDLFPYEMKLITTETPAQ